MNSRILQPLEQEHNLCKRLVLYLSHHHCSHQELITFTTTIITVTINITVTIIISINITTIIVTIISTTISVTTFTTSASTSPLSLPQCHCHCHTPSSPLLCHRYHHHQPTVTTPPSLLPLPSHPYRLIALISIIAVAIAVTIISIR